MAGSLKRGGGLTTIGALDLRNNSRYNWQNRTTDGELPRQLREQLLRARAHVVEQGGARDRALRRRVNPPQYFIAGNVMAGVFGANDVSKSHDVKETPPADYLKKAPRWEPYVATQSADDAHESVLADVGCNKSELDDHDARIIREVKDGTYTYQGSQTGFKGLIDNEADSGGHKALPKLERPSDWTPTRTASPTRGRPPMTSTHPTGATARRPNLSKIGDATLEMYLNELAGDFA